MTVEGLPLPPSANALYIQRGRRRVPTSEYQRWRRSAGLIVRAASGPDDIIPPRTPIRVVIAASASRRRDLDNIIKPSVDMLQKAGIIADDRMVDRIEALRTPGSRGTMTVTVERGAE